MNIAPLRWSPLDGWQPLATAWPASADLVLYFGTREILARPQGPLEDLATHFPTAIRAGCSTAGEILGGTVSSDGLVALAIDFEQTEVRAEAVQVAAPGESFSAAAQLAARLRAPDLRHVLVLSDGLVVNGTPLTAGFRSALPADVAVTGGLAGDGADFKRTLVGLGDHLEPGQVVAIGFYGSQLSVRHGCAGGWEAFGPCRLVTRSVGNVLYSLDNLPALELYKRYLGPRAAGLPSTGLLFPLQLLPNRTATSGLVRTILAVDEAASSLTFAGDIPEGHYVRLMKAGCDALVAGADQAGQSVAGPEGPASSFALLVSCVGRRLVMGQRTEEEVDAVLGRIGRQIPAIGFYSYGEISPAAEASICDLHNQTLTLTVFRETIRPTT